PVLSRRARLAAPTDFWSVAGSKLVPQPPADRTPNLVSRPERPPEPHSESEGETSPMEEAFVAGLSEEELPPPEHQVFIDELERRRVAQLSDKVSKEEVNHHHANE